MIELDIMVEAGGWSAVADVEALAQKAAEAASVVARRDGETLEISVMLTDDAHIRDLNRTWRGKDKATNVLSFPAPEPPGSAAAGPRHLGDIALAYETLAREADEDPRGCPVDAANWSSTAFSIFSATTTRSRRRRNGWKILKSRRCRPLASPILIAIWQLERMTFG